MTPIQHRYRCSLPVSKNKMDVSIVDVILSVVATRMAPTDSNVSQSNSFEKCSTSKEWFFLFVSHGGVTGGGKRRGAGGGNRRGNSMSNCPSWSFGLPDCLSRAPVSIRLTQCSCEGLLFHPFLVMSPTKGADLHDIYSSCWHLPHLETHPCLFTEIWVFFLFCISLVSLTFDQVLHWPLIRFLHWCLIRFLSVVRERIGKQ